VNPGRTQNIEEGDSNLHDNQRASADDTATPWVRLYPEGVGAELKQDHDDMLSMFSATVRRDADRQALIYFDREYSYGELDAQADALAAWLLEGGVRKADRVAVITQNAPAFVQLCIASWKIGAVPVPINPMYRRRELSRLFMDAEPSAVLCQDSEVVEVLGGLQDAGMAAIPVVVASAHDGQSRDDARVLPPRVSEVSQPRLAKVLDQYRGCRPPPLSLRGEDLALILYTSGTTGVPKGAMLQHRSVAFNSQFTRDWCSLSTDDLLLAVAPLFHVTGFVCNLGAALSAGCSMLLHYRFEPSVVLELVRERRPTYTIGAITAFNALLRLPEATVEDMRSLRQVYSGGAPVPPALCKAIKAQLGFDIYPAYGMTELTAPAVFSPFGRTVPEKEGVLSIGLPVPSTQIRIVDEQGTALPFGSAGEIVVRGPQVMAGYWRKPADSEAVLAGGWMHTGDIGFMDEEGWIYLLDRKKDVIIASGYKVWPREVEDVLYTHAAIREAAVIGVPDGYRGENVKACVSLVAGAAVDEAELLAYCRERLAAYKVPRFLVVMKELPKTASGKIQRVALREQ
jgi:long-chain acyl-CoA synthetase